MWTGIKNQCEKETAKKRIRKGFTYVSKEENQIKTLDLVRERRREKAEIGSVV